VPPGLRRPFGLAVSAVYSPGIGTAPLNKGLNVLGIGVEVAVVEGGYAVLALERMDLFETSWGMSHAQVLERLASLDVWTMTVTKVASESAQVTEYWSLELNPSVGEFEEASFAETWSFVVTKELAESLQLGEAWNLTLNP
jgi:hypothetical protein